MSGAPQTRASLIFRLADGRDEHSWGQFVEIYTPLVFQFARRRGLQDADAADIAQEVLSAVARAMSRGQYVAGKGTFRAWLLTITRNEVNSLLAARQRRGQPSGGTSAQLQLAAVAAPEEVESWDEDYQQRLYDWAAERVRAEVQPATWRAFQRTAVEGASGEAVARETGLSVSAVYLAKSRVMKRLQELVQSVDESEELSS
jgi:RNA polymerase sigma-70 factor (ECF subfamily)